MLSKDVLGVDTDEEEDRDRNLFLFPPAVDDGFLLLPTDEEDADADEVAAVFLALLTRFLLSADGRAAVDVRLLRVPVRRPRLTVVSPAAYGTNEHLDGREVDQLGNGLSSSLELEIMTLPWRFLPALAKCNGSSGDDGGAGCTSELVPAS